MLLNPILGIGTPPPAPVSGFLGFRAEATIAQAIVASPSVDVVEFAEIFDPENGYDGVSRFTVPASMNGKYLRVAAGVKFDSSSPDWAVYIDYNDGGGFAAIAQQSCDSPLSVSVVSPPILVSTGDEFQIYVFAGSANTQTVATFFSAWVVG